MRVGQRVRARRRITEGGKRHPGKSDAEFPDLNFIHAERGDEGIIECIDKKQGLTTVRFSPGTSTVVSPKEITLLR